MRKALLVNWSRIASRYPLSVLACALVASVFFTILAQKNLSPSKGVGAMLSGSDPKFESYMEILYKFPNESNIAVLVEGERSDMVQYVKTLNDTLSKRDDLVMHFNYLRTEEQVAVRGLGSFNTDELDEYERLIFSESLSKAIEDYAASVVAPLRGSRNFKDIDRLSDNISKIATSLSEVLRFGEIYKDNSIEAISVAGNLSETFILGDPYYTSPDGRFLLAFIEPAFNLGYDSKGNEIDQFEVIDRVGILKDILMRLSDSGINVSDARVTTSYGKPACIDLRVELKDAIQLDKTMDQIRSIADVIDIARTGLG